MLVLRSEKQVELSTHVCTAAIILREVATKTNYTVSHDQVSYYGAKPYLSSTFAEPSWQGVRFGDCTHFRERIATYNKKTTCSRPLSNGRKQLRKHIGEDHSNTSLDVLQSGVLGICATMDGEPGLEVGDSSEQGRKSAHDRVDVHVDVIRTDVRG